MFLKTQEKFLLFTLAHRKDTEYRYIKLNDLDQVRNHIREFKDELLKVVNKAGGISELSRITHIPQPSLSRFFNSNAMPRRRTLLKIAEALNLDAVRINMHWAR